MMPATKTCTLVFLRQDDQILLAMKKRGFGSGLWNGAGGKLDPGETFEQALVRESQEEIGVTPLNWEKVAIHDFVMDSNSTTAKPWHMHVHAYLCDRWEGEPHESEEMAPRWFTLADIPYDDMWQDDIVWLPLVLRGKKLTGTFIFDTDNNMTAGRFNLVETLPN